MTVTAQGTVPFPPNTSAPTVMQMGQSFMQLATGLITAATQISQMTQNTQQGWSGQASESFGQLLASQISTVMGLAATIQGVQGLTAALAGSISSSEAAYTAAVAQEQAARAGLPWTAGALAAAITEEAAAVAQLELAGATCSAGMEGISGEIAGTEMVSVGSDLADDSGGVAAGDVPTGDASTGAMASADADDQAAAQAQVQDQPQAQDQAQVTKVADGPDTGSSGLPGSPTGPGVTTSGYDEHGIYSITTTDPDTGQSQTTYMRDLNAVPGQMVYTDDPACEMGCKQFVNPADGNTWYQTQSGTDFTKGETGQVYTQQYLENNQPVNIKSVSFEGTTQSYVFDPNDNISAVRETYPDNVQVTSDPNLNVITRTDPGGPTLTLDNNAQTLTQSSPLGPTTTWHMGSDGTFTGTDSQVTQSGPGWTSTWNGPDGPGTTTYGGIYSTQTSSPSPTPPNPPTMIYPNQINTLMRL